jgi:hypothetical protein
MARGVSPHHVGELSTLRCVRVFQALSFAQRVHLVPCLQYGDAQLYNQLLFFDSLFDVERARNKASGTASQGTFATACSLLVLVLTASFPL